MVKLPIYKLLVRLTGIVLVVVVVAAAAVVVVVVVAVGSSSSSSSATKTMSSDFEMHQSVTPFSVTPSPT